MASSTSVPSFASGQLRETTQCAQSLSPDEYAKAISDHAKQAAGSSMYPGLNYESLAKYLEQPDLIHQSSHKDGNHRGKKGPQHALTLESWHKKQDYVSTYDLNVAASQDRVNHFNEIASFMKHVETQRSISTTHNALVFMRGYSSPSWLKVVGSSYRVDPEFLQRHLQIRSSIGEPDYFALPSLPSSSSNTIRLRVTTIGAWERSGRPLSQNEIDRLRADGAEAMDDYKDEVRRGHSLMVGSSIVRQFSAFDGENFAIEQDISICVNRTSSGWVVLIWSDCGRDLDQGPPGPWNKPPLHRHDSLTQLYPVIQHAPRMALEQRPKSLSGLAQTGSVSNFSQSGSIVHLDYGTQLDPTTMACDPFYSVNELYTFAAYSEVQFLNMVEKKLAARPGSTSTNHSQPDPTLSNFLYCKERLDDHVQQIQDTLASIKNRGGSEWLRALGGNSNRKEAEAAALATAQDYEYLLGRARSLSARCDQSMNIVMNNAMIRESEKAILQAEGIAKLTRLAFFYIPLSFTTSFFGMNFLQFGTGNKSIWVWFACSGPVFTLSIIFLMWDVPGMARKVLRYDAWINWIRKKFT